MNLGDATIIRADARSLPLPDDSVDLCVTSPPYFALRSYTDGGVHYDKQIGAEPTPAEFVSSLLEVTAECVRVLKPSGSLWVNLGDKYAGRSGGPQGMTGDRADRSQAATYGARRAEVGLAGIRDKSLIGIPWRYALRCIDDLGLILRAEVIWSKPNGLPESVTDRVRRSHEQWFHFVLNPRYFSAVDEIREPHGHADHMARYSERAKGYAHKVNEDRGDKGATIFPGNPLGKLPSSVWEIGGGESVVRCVLSAISTGNLTIDEGERILGASCTTSTGSTPRSPAATVGNGPQDSPPRATASSGSTAEPSSHTGSPTRSTSDESLTGCNSTTSAETASASDPTTSNPSPSATTSSAEPRPSQDSTSPRPTVATGTNTPTPTPTAPRTAAASAASASEPRTGDATGRPAPTGFDLLRSYDHEAPDPIISGGVDTDGIIGAPGSVWTVPTEPLRVPDHLGVDHFAAFPTEWPKRIIQGWSPAGVCVACGEGRRPVTDVERVIRSLKRDEKTGSGANGQTPQGGYRGDVSRVVTGYACACPEPTADTTPAVILDPFGGTGTTAMVAKALGRHGISVDMSADYCRLAEWRTGDRDQLAKVLGVAKAEQQPDTQPGLWETA